MPRIPGITSQMAVRALQNEAAPQPSWGIRFTSGNKEKACFFCTLFRIIRQGKHVIMSNGQVRLTIPRHKSINAFTMGAIAADAGLTPDEFKRLV